MQITKHNINFETDKIAATEFLTAQTRADALIMHGAGGASQKRTLALAKALADKGYRVVTFDFTSHGDSTGKLEDLNLQKRQQEAEAVISHFSLGNHLMVIGFSMSGQTAIDLIKQANINTLVLFAPGVYDKKARTAPFGPESAFTKLIRMPNSWQKSDAWEKLGYFKGNCLIFEGEFDTVIPKPIPKAIYENANLAQSRLHIKVVGADHSLAKWMREDPEKAQWFAAAIHNFDSQKSLDDSNSTKIQFLVENEEQ